MDLRHATSKWWIAILVSIALLITWPVASGAPNPANVRRYQQQLLDLGYWLPSVNGLVDRDTTHAVIAFQKVAGLPRNGLLDDATKQGIEKEIRPAAQSEIKQRIIEVDVAKQILKVVKDGRVLWILDVSTGKPSTPTKRGFSRIYREYDGLRASGMYRPKYFWRSAAIHGYATVPNYAASHGCVRVTNTVMDWLWKKDALPSGMSIWVY